MGLSLLAVWGAFRCLSQAGGHQRAGLSYLDEPQAQTMAAWSPSCSWGPSPLGAVGGLSFWFRLGRLSTTPDSFVDSSHSQVSPTGSGPRLKAAQVPLLAGRRGQGTEVS